MKVYPVIHVETVPQVVRDARTAAEHPVDGVFLIAHDADDARLVEAFLAVRTDFPDLFLGVNFIRRTRREALEILRQRGVDSTTIDAIWADSADLDGASDEGSSAADAEGPVHFGGIAFKYQQPVPLEELPALGERARQQIDVPTTSGFGTGEAADLERLRALRNGLGDHPLALASGVTPENVSEYADLVTHVLVATGIASGEGGIDAHKLAKLLSRVAG
jgi:hypothetical protein